MMMKAIYLLVFVVCLSWGPSLAFAATPLETFLRAHCYDCHTGEDAEGHVDLTTLSREFRDAADFAKWVRVYDMVASGEMPPKDQPGPTGDEREAVSKWLKAKLIEGEHTRLATDRTPIRRLTRVEYENTMRDLFGMDHILLADRLPADGSAHGFDRNAEALSISHVNMAKYIEAADYVLDQAIAIQPKPPTVHKQRISLAEDYGVGLLISNTGGAVYLKDKKPDPEFPPTNQHQHVDRAAHHRLGLYDRDSSVGVFRHEDESFGPRFQSFSAIYPGRYRVRTSLWSYTWDKGQVTPGRGTEAVRLSVIQLQGIGRGGGHPSYVLGYFDAPAWDAKVHEFEWWFNPGETLGYNVASLAPVHIYHQYKRNVMSFTGPGIACDWLEVEGPLYDQWPPQSHQVLFGDLPLVKFDAKEKGTNWPNRVRPRQTKISTKNRPDEYAGDVTVHSDEPLSDARRLLSSFLPKAFRRPVDDGTLDTYVEQVAKRLEAGDCFELAMRWVYRAALCSPDFLYHIEPAATEDKGSTAKPRLDDFAVANRLAYFLWGSMPDGQLLKLAEKGELRKSEILRQEVRRLLNDPKSQRFVEDFIGQWLRVREIAATDPDRKLYPEFSTYLQNSMVAEAHAFFRELIDKDLDASHLIDSDFAMLNEKLAVHYGIEGVSGSQIRRVKLPPHSPRGGFLTQAAILKVTANGTTTSPVPRGAFVMDRLLGMPPSPPPENVPAVEPDVQGATTIRELLAKHQADRTCAGCHAKIDPAGFALESFDVIGGFRDRYRSVGEGDPAPRGSIDPSIHVGFKLGPEVDSSGQLPDGRQFDDVVGLKKLLKQNQTGLLTNLARQFATYSIGRELTFSDRDAIAAIVAKTETSGGGVRTLIHELVESELFKQP